MLLALFEFRDKDAVRATCEVGLAHSKREVSKILAIERENIEGVELHAHALRSAFFFGAPFSPPPDLDHLISRRPIVARK